VLGGGERAQPGHPHAIPFARLLLAAGADPDDGQALYDRMFGTRDDHLELLFEFGLGQGPGGPWHRLPGDQLESPRVMLRNLLARAVTHDQRERVARLARNGVDVVSPVAASQGAPESVPLLAAAGFDVSAFGRSDVPSNERWHTALHVAAERGDLRSRAGSWSWAQIRTGRTGTTGARRSAGRGISASSRLSSCWSR
jgi:hypothetical protein